MENPNKPSHDALLSLANNLRWDLGVNLHDAVIESIYEDASRIARNAVHKERRPSDLHPGTPH